MVALYLILAIILTTACIIIPIQSAQADEAERIFAESYRNHKLRWIRRSYPELQNLSYREIIEHYQVDDAYERITVRNFDITAHEG